MEEDEQELEVGIQVPLVLLVEWEEVAARRVEE
jgi:hypothetical protein